MRHPSRRRRLGGKCRLFDNVGGDAGGLQPFVVLGAEPEMLQQLASLVSLQLVKVGISRNKKCLFYRKTFYGLGKVNY